jgi:hypothetical protein
MPPSSGKYKPLAALAHIIAYCELWRISQQQAIANDFTAKRSTGEARFASKDRGGPERVAAGGATCRRTCHRKALFSGLSTSSPG